MKIEKGNSIIEDFHRRLIHTHATTLTKVLKQCLNREPTEADANRIKIAAQPGKNMAWFVMFDLVVVGVLEGRFETDLMNATQKYVCEFTPAADYKG